jgi:hypothetical protein
MNNKQIKIIENLAAVAKRHIEWHKSVNDEGSRRVMTYSVGQLAGAYAMIRDTCDPAVTRHVNEIFDLYSNA